MDQLIKYINNQNNRMDILVKPLPTKQQHKQRSGGEGAEDPQQTSVSTQEPACMLLEPKLKISMQQHKLRIELTPLHNDKIRNLDNNIQSYDEQRVQECYYGEIGVLDQVLLDWFDSLQDLCQYMNQNNYQNINIHLQQHKIGIYVKTHNTIKKKVQIYRIKLTKIHNTSRANIKIENKQVMDYNNVPDTDQIDQCIKQIDNKDHVQDQDIKYVLKNISNKLIHIWDTHYNNAKIEETHPIITNNNGNTNQIFNSFADISRQSEMQLSEQIYKRVKNIQNSIKQLKDKQENKLASIDDKMKCLYNKMQTKVKYISGLIANCNYVNNNNHDDGNKDHIDNHQDVNEQIQIQTKTSNIKQQKQAERDNPEPKSKNKAQKTKRTYKKKKHIRPKQQNQKLPKPKIQEQEYNTRDQNRQGRNPIPDKLQQMLQYQQYQPWITYQAKYKNAQQSNSNSFENGQRKIYKVRNKLPQNTQSSHNVPSFIDANSPYVSFFSFDQNKITLIRFQGVPFQTTAVMLMGTTTIRQKNIFKFRIIKSKPMNMICIGIVNQAHIHRQTCRVGDNITRINSRGYVCDGKKSMKMDDFVFSMGDTITMRILIEYCLVQWTVQSGASFSCVNMNINKLYMKWVPFIEIKKVGDCVEWIQ